MSVIPADAGGPSASWDGGPTDGRSRCHSLGPEGVNAVALAVAGGGGGDSVAAALADVAVGDGGVDCGGGGDVG